MVKTIHFSTHTWIADRIVEANRPKGMNKSEWISQLLVQGYEVQKEREVSQSVKKGPYLSVNPESFWACS